MKCWRQRLTTSGCSKCIDAALLRETFKIRVVAGHIAAKAVGLQSGFGQNTGYSRMIGAKFGRQLPSTPVRRAILAFLSNASMSDIFGTIRFPRCVRARL